MKPTRFVNINLNDLKILFNFLITSTKKKILHPLRELLKQTEAKLILKLLINL